MAIYPPSPRADLLYENVVPLNGVAFQSVPTDSTGVTTIRVAAWLSDSGSGGLWVTDWQDAANGGSPLVQIRSQNVSASSGFLNGDFEITGRYFSFEVSSGSGAATCAVTVRSV